MSEDCLTLNVVSPQHARPGDGLPVVFYIHGGGVVGSSATPIYDGAALARRGVVFVSANYRLGALGTLDLSPLSTADVTIESNLYLRDLILALCWVCDNIAAFGGDADNVTIMGESAGGHAVVALLSVPEAGGLFARAVAQSPFSGMVRSRESAQRIAQDFAELLGADMRGAADELMTAQPDRLVRAMTQLTRQMLAANPGDMTMAGATIDGDFLPCDPFEAVAQGRAHRVPLIVGHTADEATIFNRFVRVIPTTVATIEQSLAGRDPAVRSAVLGGYPGYPNPASCVLLGGDMCFNAAAWRLGEAHAHYAPTFVYRYDFAPKAMRWLGLGATHGADLLPLFGIYQKRMGAVLSMFGDRRTAQRVSDEMQSRWATFIRTGNPGPGWPAYDEAERSVLIIDETSRVEGDPHEARRQSWEGFDFAR